MHCKAILVVLITSAFAAMAQDAHSWEALGKLQTGDRVRVSLKNRAPITGAFEGWTPEQMQVTSVTAPKADVVRVERLQAAGSGRGKHAAIGAVIGFGAGFAVGAAVGGCRNNQIGPCISRGTLGAAMGGAGAGARWWERCCHVMVRASLFMSRGNALLQRASDLRFVIEGEI